MRILLIEDDALIGNGILNGLKKSAGMSVDWFQDGREGMLALASAPYEAVILDLSLPSVDGLQILHHWREHGLNTPVLILTARSDLSYRLEGFRRGADDYLIKPFSLEEVAARLYALVRRSHGFAHPLLEYGALRLDSSAKTASLNGKVLDLNSREYMLLELFLLNQGRVLSRAQIEDHLYGWEQEIESNVVEVHIHHLRKKIGDRFILTKRRLGYILGDKP